LKKLVLLFSFYFNSLLAIEVTCNFEEVYKNGEVQEGVMMLNDNLLRYQYTKDNLFTIISKQNQFYLIRNDSKTVQKLSDNTESLKNFIILASDYPDINETYQDKDLFIKVEKSEVAFIKRLSIQSNDISLSVNFFNCKFQPINKKYFRHFNFIEYNQ
tara:strand:- start:1663 stop:2136 length:474 start_codon:yes stop_codon:yes gene_type:complete